tara:strand:+ start:415 stop:1140 length:726 start_codon:yes stop_codon:yes gene_type:complete
MRSTDFILNIHEKKSSLSKLATQLLYGESFIIQKKYKNWIKIKNKYDNYIGYIKKKKFKPKVINTHKVNKLSAEIYKKPNNNFKIKKQLSFCSFISVKKKEKNFYKFDNYWIKKKDVTPISKTEDIFSKIKIFKGVKYKWGGVSFKGIDCSALIQVFYKYNNKFCPRDTKDQIRFFKRLKNTKFFKKNDLIFWKGHVAVCINSKSLIHAYGPKKKVIIMNIKKTINDIRQNANLNMIGKMK